MKAIAFSLFLYSIIAAPIHEKLDKRGIVAITDVLTLAAKNSESVELPNMNSITAHGVPSDVPHGVPVTHVDSVSSDTFDRLRTARQVSNRQGKSQSLRPNRKRKRRRTRHGRRPASRFYSDLDTIYEDDMVHLTPKTQESTLDQWLNYCLDWNLFDGISTIIFDIEGTTTPIYFVKNILFGYIRQHLKQFINENYDKDWMSSLKSEIKVESKEELERMIIEFMNKDSKVSWLKSFQGRMWNFGYESSNIKGQVYSDVYKNFKKWYSTFNLGIYSSGSIHAQKLLFKYSEAGDLTKFLNFHFDTTNAGAKTNSHSFRLIVKQLGVEPSKILFLSDSIHEIVAASSVGIKVCRVDRDNSINSGNVVNNFDELDVMHESRKRKYSD